ncbi:ComEA family DNA-binding protein [Actinomycetaceae bacterium TAE3-ERU4]|nr:ComEA family DNA-binding protein [Actinomycetaceae bacterium TAE3-ERU4]
MTKTQSTICLKTGSKVVLSLETKDMNDFLHRYRAEKLVKAVYDSASSTDRLERKNEYRKKGKQGKAAVLLIVIALFLALKGCLFFPGKEVQASYLKSEMAEKSEKNSHTEAQRTEKDKNILIENDNFSRTLKDAKESEQNKEKLMVYVSGAVNAPGVYELEKKKRVIDALKAAGGVKKEGNVNGINLAKPLEDAAHIHVPISTKNNSEEEGKYAKSAGNDGIFNRAKISIDINSATSNELQKIPGVGPALAERIIQSRKSKGRFQNIEDLSRVKGISKRIIESVKESETIEIRK